MLTETTDEQVQVNIHPTKEKLTRTLQMNNITLYQLPPYYTLNNMSPCDLPTLLFTMLTPYLNQLHYPISIYKPYYFCSSSYNVITYSCNNSYHLYAIFYS